MTIHQESNFDLSDFLAETLKNQNLKTQTNLNGNGFVFNNLISSIFFFRLVVVLDFKFVSSGLQTER